MSIIDRDCSLDLHEALQLLELMFFTFSHADSIEDWFDMREPIGSGIHAVECLLRQVIRTVEDAAGSQIVGRVD